MVAKYRLSEKTFIQADGTQEAWLYEKGQEMFFSGSPSRNMIALNTEAVAALAAIPPLSASAKNIAPRRGDAA
jgi:hypothetical protein